MAVETKYYCDNCKAEVKSRYDLFTLKMALHKGNDLPVTGSMDICKLCAEEVGYKEEQRNSHEYSFFYKIKKFFKE